MAKIGRPGLPSDWRQQVWELWKTGSPIRARSWWIQRPNRCAPTLIPAATAAIVRSVPITRCAASRRYSGVCVLLFFVDPVKDILSGGP